MIESITPAPGIHPWGANGAPMEQKLPLGVALFWTPPPEKTRQVLTPPQGGSGPLPQAI